MKNHTSFDYNRLYEEKTGINDGKNDGKCLLKNTDSAFAIQGAEESPQVGFLSPIQDGKISLFGENQLIDRHHLENRLLKIVA